MIKKEYRARSKAFSTSIRLGGVVRRIVFETGYKIGSAEKKAFYVTTNEEVQEALEKSCSFGTLYYLASAKGKSEKVVAAPAPAPKQEVETIETITEVAEVTTVKEAIAFFTKEPYNLRVVQCNSKSKIKLRLKENNLEFPNIKYEI